MTTLHGYITSETGNMVQFVSASADRMNAKPVTIQRNDIAERIDLGISPADIKLSGGITVKAQAVTLHIK